MDLGFKLRVDSDCGRIDFKNTLQGALRNLLDAKYFESVLRAITSPSQGNGIHLRKTPIHLRGNKDCFRFHFSTQLSIVFHNIILRSTGSLLASLQVLEGFHFRIGFLDCRL